MIANSNPWICEFLIFRDYFFDLYCILSDKCLLFVGLNIANNLIDHDGVELLVRSIRNNTALHAILLGGNPGFSTEAAQFSYQSTSKVPSRLSFMPKGISMLLKRWMQLQSSETLDGPTSNNTSVSAYPNFGRYVNQSTAEPLRNDTSDWDVDSSRMSRQMTDMWVKSSGSGELHDHDHSESINKSHGREMRASGEGTRGQFQYQNQDLEFQKSHIPKGVQKENSARDVFEDRNEERNEMRNEVRKELGRVSRNQFEVENENDGVNGHKNAREYGLGHGIDSFKEYLKSQLNSSASLYPVKTSTPAKTRYNSANTPTGNAASHSNSNSNSSTPFTAPFSAVPNSRNSYERRGNSSNIREHYNYSETPNSYSGIKTPVPVHRVRSTSVGSTPLGRKEYLWASSSASGTMGQMMRNLISPQGGDRGARGGGWSKERSHSASRAPSPSLVARRQASACARLSKGEASAERCVPPMRAKSSPSRPHQNRVPYSTDSRERERERNRDRDRDRDNERRNTDRRSRSVSASKERNARSPSQAHTRYRDDYLIDGSTHREVRKIPKSEGSSTKKKKKSKTATPMIDIKQERDEERERLALLQQQVLEGVLSRFSHSVKEMNRSLESVSDQLRDVSGSLSASMLERARNYADKGSPLPVVRTHTEQSPFVQNSPARMEAPLAPTSVRTDTSSDHSANGISLNHNSAVKSTVPPGIHGMNNVSAHTHLDAHVDTDVDAGVHTGTLRDNLGETFGRSRGSLMHRSGTWTGEGLMDEPAAVPVAQVEVKQSLLSAFMTLTKVKEKEKEKEKEYGTHVSTHVSPKKTVSDVIHNRHTHSHTNTVSPSPVSSSHDRWSARIMSASLPTHKISASSERSGISNGISNGISHGNSSNNGVVKILNGIKNGQIPLHEPAVLSDAEIATLIRDRLRKKLKSVLRPKVPPNPLGPPSSASP